MTHARAAIWLVLSLSTGSGCEGRSGTTVTPRAEGPSASEWTGERAPVDPPRAGPVSVPRAAWVLHVGDSFVDASLKQNLAGHLRAAGAQYVVRSTTASYTTTWAYSPVLDDMLSRRPSLVIVTLGANEFDMPFAAAHARPIEIIARKIARSGATCIWTSPPMWKPDTGIVQVIHDHCAPCFFFDSDAVLGGLARSERRGDRIHPNPRGGARWADALWGWIASHRDPDRGPWGLVPFEDRRGQIL
jgi:lysophospholipase L1-like esterase